jgi:hypothetical protein
LLGGAPRLFVRVTRQAIFHGIRAGRYSLPIITSVDLMMATT